MVVVEIEKNDLLNLVGKELSNEQIEEALFLLKVETTFQGDNIVCELNPDRPDMFSVEGIARAMKGFLGMEAKREYNIQDSKLKVSVEEIKSRPFMACAVIRNISFTSELIKSLMQLQEKLHTTIGRNRKKVAMGINDLERLKPPFVYKAVSPEEISFIPLEETREMNLKEILKEHPKGIDYAYLLEGEEKYPVFMDAAGAISFPPIIMSDRVKLTERTKNILIDVTGTDEKAVSLALNIVVTSILERTGELFSVKVSKKTYPDFEEKIVSITVEEVDKFLGLGLYETEIVKNLERMLYKVPRLKSGKIDVLIPPFRGDIMHNVDLIEDIAIAYGYNNIEPVLPKVPTIGGISEEEKLGTKIRELMVGLGFQEILTFTLTNEENIFKKMNIENREVVRISNPVSNEYEICRDWLLPSLLKVLTINKHREYPQMIFELGECIVLDEKEETKTRSVKKLTGVISHDNANLTEMKSVIEAISRSEGKNYSFKPYNHPSFIESRCGEIVCNEKNIGFFGEVSPIVLENWKLEKPVIAFEIEI